MRERVQAIMQNWNVDSGDRKQIYDTAWQIGDKYVLKVYDNAQMLERNIKIISILSDRNIPVGKLIYTNENVSFAKDELYYYILTEKLAGSNIVNIGNTPEIGVKMGEIIADLHVAFQECEKQEEFWDNSLLAEMKGWIRDTFYENGWKCIEERAFCDIAKQLDLVYNELPVQLIHRDVHFGNFLFAHNQFSGYIDFDLSQRNIRIFDLCYFLLGLLSEKGKFDITSEEWFLMVKDVFAGYNHKITLLEAERKAAPYVMESIELLFAAWFLGQNDMKCVGNAIEIYRFINSNIEKIDRLISDGIGL